MKAKPWQIALIVIGLAVGLGSVVWFAASGDTVRLSQQYYLIDVESGELFDVDSSKYKLMLPARHPDTGRITLVGVSKDEDGSWYVPRRQLGLLRQLEAGVEVKAIDSDSGELRSTPGKPRRYVKK